MKKPTPAPVVPAGLSPSVLAKVKQWQETKQNIADAQAFEMTQRKELAALFVPTPTEGTNKVAGFGFEVVLKHKINRTLDVPALDSVMPQLAEEFRVVGTLIQYKPAFDLAAYKAMPDDQRKIFEQALTIKDGAPDLKIILREEEPPAETPTPVMDAYHKAKGDTPNPTIGAPTAAPATAPARKKTTAP